VDVVGVVLRQRSPCPGQPLDGAPAIAGAEGGPSSDDHQRRARGELVGGEHADPTLDRRVARVRRHDGAEPPRHHRLGPVDLVGEQGVDDGAVPVAVVVAPLAGPAMDRPPSLGVSATELVLQELRHQVVEPEPLASVVERDHEQHAALQRVEQLGGPTSAEDAVAKGPRDPLEAGRLHEERGHVGVQCGQQLLGEEVGQVPMLTAEAVDEVGDAISSRRLGEGGQVQGDRPPLGLLDQSAHIVRRSIHAERVEEGRRFRHAERQLVRADLDQAALHPHPAEGERDRRAAGQHERGPRRQLADQHREAVQRVAADELVDVVEHEYEGRRAASTAPRRCTPGEPMVGDPAHSAAPQPGATGSISSIAAATWDSRTAGWSSADVRETQASGRSLRIASSATNVDLP
jgi:hypothetical protein